MTPIAAHEMHAFQIDAAKTASVRKVQLPAVGPLDVLVRVERVGLCGTDQELFAGTMPYFASGLARYPLRPGHEWVGVIAEIGEDVQAVARGQRVTADTFIGCGECVACGQGRHHLCDTHVEIGVRGGRDGALAEYVLVPGRAVHVLPQEMPPEVGAFVEPASCALRGVLAAALTSTSSVLVWGAGTIGLLAAWFVTEITASVTVAVRTDEQRSYVRSLGFDDVVLSDDVEEDRYTAVIDATGADDVPPRAARLVTPGGTIVLLGVPGGHSTLDVATVVHRDLTVHGVLGGSAFIDDAIDRLAAGAFDVTRLIGRTLSLTDVAKYLGDPVPSQAPKVQVDLG
jgi:2-desacetyl-2-hydroxyethyl bacteriochlorophyllide A dehydrogenase